MAQTPEEKAAAKAAKEAKTSVSVYSKDDQLIRTYDQETHGDDFADLAKEFSDHTPGSEVR